MMQDSLSQTFSALADPTRRAMLAQLKLGESSVSDLAKPYNMSLPAVTKHIKVLEKAGLITKTKEAQWRPCKLKEDGLKEVSDWMEEYRVYWEASFDRLEVYLKSVTADKGSETERENKKSKKESSEKQWKKGRKNDRKK
ncbi:MAG: metalloregulator ArsR/SmtB family transcription factor [Candidatus Obscuribacterales bacterium]|jgi:DNA-binding transcriptional ArsR family regulator